MTQPVAHGYPDWNRVASRADVIYTRATQTAINPTRTLGPFFVGHQPAVALNASSPNGGFLIRLDFYADAALTQILDSHVIGCAGTGWRIDQSFTVLGPYMTIMLSPDIVPGSITVFAWATAAPGTIQSTGDGNILITTTSNAIAIGATETLDASMIWPGNAFLCFQQTAGTCTLTLSGRDSAGTSTNIWRRVLTAAQPVGEMICLPAQRVRASVNNTSGAATDYSLYLIGQPHIMRS